MDLPSDEVHVYLAAPLALRQPDRVRRYLSWLQGDEEAQYGRFLFDEHRQEYLITRALVRGVLSAYVPRAPEAWRFVRTAHGRPEVALAAADPQVSWLTFNLSNTRELVACAVVRGREVGVDVEYVDREGEALAVADRYFAADELAELRARPAELQRDRFFDYWTLKEAYLKAHGKGLTLPLRAFSMVLREGGPIGLTVRPPIVDDAASWQLELQSPTQHHRLAVAVRRRADPPLRMKVQWLEP